MAAAPRRTPLNAYRSLISVNRAGITIKFMAMGHLIRERTHMMSAVGGGGGSPKGRRSNRGCMTFIV